MSESNRPINRSGRKESRSRDLDHVMGSRFTERTGLENKWITSAEWEELMAQKKEAKKSAEETVVPVIFGRPCVHSYRLRQETRGFYSNDCPVCGRQPWWLEPDDRALKALPSFFVCFECKFVSQVGFGRLNLETLKIQTQIKHNVWRRLTRIIKKFFDKTGEPEPQPKPILPPVDPGTRTGWEPKPPTNRPSGPPPPPPPTPKQK